MLGSQDSEMKAALRDVGLRVEGMLSCYSSD
jgi:hypothetical protein